MSASRRILIIRLSSLGDILHALPAFADLRAAFPDARIEWLVAEKNRSLLSAVGGVDEIHALDVGRPADTARLVRALRRRRFDCCIDFQGLLKSALLGRLSGARSRLGFSRALAREYPAHWFYSRTLETPAHPVHVLQLNRMLAALAGAVPARAPLPLEAPAEDVRQIESLLRLEGLQDFVVINPGGGWPTKRWSPGRYGLLAARIEGELGLSVVATAGPGEESLIRAMREHCGNYVPRFFEISFLRLIPLFRKARLVIGGDTGPFHLACALGIPVVGVFGPTSPVRNGPWSADDAVVAHTLPCSHCYGRTCPTANECMDIPVDEVFAAVVRRLAGTGE